MALAPFSWTPTSIPPNSTTPGTPIPGGRLLAGDWAQVSLSYRNTNTTQVVHAINGFFFVHVLFVPDSDDATPHPDVATTYGGVPANRRSIYRIDPGWWFQAPFNGSLFLIAGDDSDPATCVLDVVLRRGHVPQDAARIREYEQRLRDGGGMISGPGGNVQFMCNPLTPTYRSWSPPIVGTPQEVPSTWIDVPVGSVIQFPDGASRIEAVSDLAAVPGNVVSLTIATLGAVSRINIAPGLPRSIGHLAQGGACTNGVPATWTPIATTGTLRAVTVWSKLGG